MPVPEVAAVTSFQRRAFVGTFFGWLCRVVLVVAVAAAVVQVAVRLWGGHLVPQPWWAALLLPVVAFAWWRARRERLPRAMAAQHLDRRLQLHGLLVCAQEGQQLEPAWQERLAQRLELVPTVMPRVQWKRLLPWPVCALVLAVAVALLPPPPPPPAPLAKAAIGAEVERLAETMRDLLARAEVPEESKKDLEQKLQELQQRLAAGDVPDWREVDQLEQRLEREQLLQSAIEAGKHGAPDAAAGTKAGAITPQQLAAAANALQAAGLLDELPAEVRAMLERAAGEKGFDPSGLPQDAAALQRLAEAMAAAGALAGSFDARTQLDPAQLADLQAVLDAFAGQPGAGQGDGEGEGEGEGLDGDGAGRGGVNRGPGHAALAMTEDAQGGAEGAMALPPGAAAPTEWVPIGSRAIEPQVQPVTNTAAGGAGAAGTGGASWQLQLAPRHRAVVQRFFGDAAGERKEPR